MSLATPTTPLIAALEHLRPHDHLCSIYDSQEEQFSIAMPFIRIGLDRGEKCLYIADNDNVDAVREAMRDAGIDVERATRFHALALITKELVYLQHGSFNPDWILSFWEEATELSMREGFAALRTTGETEWVLRGDLVLERWLAYESRLTHMLSAHHCFALCQYNRRLFPPERILDIIRTHPTVIYRGTVCRNLYYVSPDELLGTNQPAREVERLLTNIREREAVEYALEQQRDELRASEQRVRLMVEGVKDYAIFMVDPKGRVTSWNAGAERITGYREEEMLGQHFSRLYPPDDATEGIPEAALRVVAATGKTANEGWRLRKNGTRFWADVLLSAVRDDAGHLIGVAHVIRDTTERQQAQGLLRAANERVERILDSITDNFFALSQDWRFTYFNTHAAAQMKVLGKDPARLIGKVLWEEFPHVPNEASLRRVMSDRVVITDKLYYPPLGEWVENHMYPSPDGGLVTFQKYITARKRAEEALRRSEAYLADAQRLSHTGSWAWHVSTGALFWSQEHFRICGLDPDRVKPSYDMFFQLVHPEDRPLTQQTFDQAVRDRNDFELDYRIVRSDGMIRHIRSIAHPVFNASGNLTEYVGTIIDTTERQQAEAEVHRAYEGLEQQVRERTAALAHANEELRAEIAERHRAEAALARRNQELLGLYEWVEQDRALKATLLKELNHRVRNNLASVIGILEIERERAHQRTADEALAARAARLQAIAWVYDLLAAGAFAPMDLRDFIAVVAGGIMLHAEASAPQIAIVYDEASLKLPPKPFLALACVTNELILNAVKHAFHGRAHGRIEIRAWEEGDRYVLEVRDDGVGFPAGAEAVGTGLEIVATLCTTDLRGDCRFLQEGGTIARIAFPKAVAAGGGEP